MSNLLARICWFMSLIVSLPLHAQAPVDDAMPVDQQQEKSNDQKMVREANINLRTTVTGNQEQPRVMYILPWQSPASPELEMEMLSSQQDAVFGHVERDELQRSLDASGELDEIAAD